MTKEQLERLAILSEELGEVQQVIGKIIRHGYASYSPFDESQTTNRELLWKEVGDVEWIISLMKKRGDLSTEAVDKFRREKSIKVKPYLHHNEI